MKQKIILSLIAVVAMAGGVAAMSAFEAHVINVTAHIENALGVSTYELQFGTVFPQEYLTKEFTVGLSASFLGEDRVDDVEYKIIQKPKCWNNNPSDPQYAPVNYATHQCPQGFVQMPLLCPFLSKTDGDPEDNNDGAVLSYYVDVLEGEDYCITPDPDYAAGYLSKKDGDTTDTWIVDLKVPPVTGTVGQDWPLGCPTISAEADYGCDLWIEVTGISLSNGEIGCSEKADVMQVLDRSGSITTSGAEATLKNAAKAFVDALAPTSDGVHMGQTSFSDTGTLDLHLTHDVTDIKNAIDGLSFGGYTNLKEGIELATGELDNPTYDRDDVESPDFMVIITDGEPNRPNPATARADAEAAANAADADGVIIYVVGVAVPDQDTSDWLKNYIATTPNHYFDVANWEALEVVLEDLASCDGDEPPAPYCGDGIVNNGEQCESAADCADGEVCNSCACEPEPYVPSCGNGTLDPGEECDDGNNSDNDGCSAACLNEFCGDGIVNNGEQCESAGDCATGEVCTSCACVAGCTSQTTSLFADGFESGNFSAWNQADNDWYITTDGEHSGTYAAFAADQGQSDDNLRKAVSTSGYDNVTLNYWYKIAQSIETNEHVRVEWYNGSSWNQVADYTNVASGSWTQVSLSLAAGADNNASFEIRFRASDLDPASNDKFMLDDVEVTGDTICP